MATVDGIRDDGGDPLVWPVRIASALLGSLAGFAASIAVFALAPGAALLVLLLGFLALAISAAVAGRARCRYWAWFLGGAAAGLVLGGGFLIWVLGRMAGAY